MDPIELEKEYIAPTYTRQPLTIVEGDGVIVKDIEGNEYLDFVAGIAVCSLGHSHPSVLKALEEQGRKLVHISNLYYTLPQIELAKKLSEITPEGIKKFFFCTVLP